MLPKRSKKSNLDKAVASIRREHTRAYKAYQRQLKAIREHLEGLLGAPTKQLRPKVIQGMVTSEAILMDKMDATLRALRDLEGEAGASLAADWDDIVVLEAIPDEEDEETDLAVPA